ncbi:MAG: hypothetical protein QM571_07565 [Micrococcaceae bacterium]
MGDSLYFILTHSHNAQTVSDFAKFKRRLDIDFNDNDKPSRFVRFNESAGANENIYAIVAFSKPVNISRNKLNKLWIHGYSEIIPDRKVFQKRVRQANPFECTWRSARNICDGINNEN